MLSAGYVYPDDSSPVALRSLLRRKCVVGVTLLLILGSAIAAGWWQWSGSSANGVQASWVPSCEGTQVSSYREPGPGDSELNGQAVIDSRPGFSCTILLTVTNASNSEAHITSIFAPLLGPRGGAEFVGTIAATDDLSVAPTRSDSVDATFDVSKVVPAGGQATLEFPISWRPSGCNSAGHLWVKDWLTISFDMLGRSHEVSTGQALIMRTHDGDHPRREGC